MAKQISVGSPVNAAERWAFNYLKDNLPDDYLLLTNLDLYDERGRPFEVDAIVIGSWAVYLVDVKGYKGELIAGKDVWVFRGNTIQSPFAKINHNARILASRCRKHIRRGQHSPWCQGMVFVTGGEGGDVILDKNGRDELPVYDSSEIIDALTKSEYLTSHHKNVLEKYQRDIALNSLCDFKLIQSKRDTLAGYRKEKLVFANGKVETWVVSPVSGSLDYKYWMKFIDLTGLSESEVEFYRESLKGEFRFLSELSDIKCVPAPLMFWDDGESVALVHSFVPGEKITDICLSDEVLSDVIFSLVDSVVKIHSKGFSCSGLIGEYIYISTDGVVTFGDIAGMLRVSDTDRLGEDAKAIADIFKPHLFDVKDGKLERSRDCPSLRNVFLWFEDVLFASNFRPLSSLLDIFEEQSRESLVDTFLPEEGAVLNGKYEFLSCLGRGSLSTVWKARHLIGDYICSIKLLDEFEGADELARKEFEILRTSFHPNIVRIFDLDKVPGTTAYYLTTQYLDGESLDQLECSRSKLWIWFRDILSAIQYLHRIGIIHKDIKPQNIIVDSGKAYLIDFNLSSFDTPAIGTIKYKDPLVFETGWTEFSDVYSLVITFLELYLKKHPFRDYGEIPKSGVPVNVPNKIEGLSSASRSRLVQIVNRQVDWSVVKDYLAWFGLRNQTDITLSDSVKEEWNISDGYMSKVLICMLSDMQARSRQVVINSTLKAYDIVGNKSARGSISAAISALKRNKVVVEKGTKIALSEEFVASWKKHCAN